MVPGDGGRPGGRSGLFCLQEGCIDSEAALYLRVIGGHVLILVILAPGSLAADVDFGDDEVDYLLASPQGFRLEDGRHGHPAVPVLQPHQDVHEQVFLDEAVPLRHQPAAQQGVLHDTNDGLVGLQAQLLAAKHVAVDKI